MSIILILDKKMRRISNFQWLLILTISACVVFTVGAASLYIRFKLPDMLPENINDSPPSWTFGSFWAIHVPLLLILSRRFSFERGRLTKSLLLSFSAGIVWTTIANVERIKDIRPLFKGEYVITLTSGVRLKSSRGYRHELQSLLDEAR